MRRKHLPHSANQWKTHSSAQSFLNDLCQETPGPPRKHLGNALGNTVETPWNHVSVIAFCVSQMHYVNLCFLVLPPTWTFLSPIFYKKLSFSRRVQTQETTVPSLIRLGSISPERQLAVRRRESVKSLETQSPASSLFLVLNL